MKSNRGSSYGEKAGSARQFVPETRDLTKLRNATESCRGCDLYKRATQAVFGEGKRKARMVFVGEQPGDAEDLAGHPFVGPAGKLLDRALEQAGIDRSLVYVPQRSRPAARGSRLRSRRSSRGSPWSSILRAPDDEARRLEMEQFVTDLEKIAAELARMRGRAE